MRKCRPTTFGASSENQFNRHKFKKKKIESGPDLLSAGPCSEKKGGPSPVAANPIFPGKKLATFLDITVRVSGVSSPQKLATFFCSSLSFTRMGVAHYFRHAKICRSFCGGPFCGAPVRPNMLNMPKSAAE